VAVERPDQVMPDDGWTLWHLFFFEAKTQAGGRSSSAAIRLRLRFYLLTRLPINFAHHDVKRSDDRGNIGDQAAAA